MVLLDIPGSCRSSCSPCSSAHQTGRNSLGQSCTWSCVECTVPMCWSHWHTPPGLCYHKNSCVNAKICLTFQAWQTTITQKSEKINNYCLEGFSLLTTALWLNSDVKIFPKDILCALFLALEGLWSQWSPLYNLQKLCFHVNTLPNWTFLSPSINLPLFFLLEIYKHSACPKVVRQL